MKSPIPYSGGKQRVAQQIADLLPPHRSYVEPFAGALSVLLAKPPSELETANDIDHAIITFWRVLRDRPEELERACALTPHSRAERRIASSLEGEMGELEVARRVWALVTQTMGAQVKADGTWLISAGGGLLSLPRKLNRLASKLAPVAERLQNVSLECRPALEIIRIYGGSPETVLYCDPPYPSTTRSGAQYRHEVMAALDHIELIEALKGCSANVVLSSYSNPLYNKSLAGWERVEMRSLAMTRGARTEVVWMNYTPEPNLFSGAP